MKLIVNVIKQNQEIGWISFSFGKEKELIAQLLESQGIKGLLILAGDAVKDNCQHQDRATVYWIELSMPIKFMAVQRHHDQGTDD